MVTCSVIIPLFNKRSEVSRAITSVLAQTFQNFEIIVIDDGSTDNGAELVTSCRDPRIHLVQQENAGASAARNRGVAEARGEWVALLDADDEWKPTFLKTVLRLQELFPQAAAFATSYMYCTEGVFDRPRYRHLPSEPWEGIIDNFFRCSLGDSPLLSSAVMLNKRILDEIGGFPLGQKIAEDLDTWIRIAARYPIAWTSKVEALYYLDTPFSTTKTTKIKNDFITIETLTLLSTEKREYKKDIENLIAKHYLTTAGYYQRFGDTKNFRRCLGKAMRFSSGRYFSHIIVKAGRMLLQEVRSIFQAI